MKRANTSLPVPVSPLSKTVASLGAIRAEARSSSTSGELGPKTRSSLQRARAFGGDESSISWEPLFISDVGCGGSCELFCSQQAQYQRVTKLTSRGVGCDSLLTRNRRVNTLSRIRTSLIPGVPLVLRSTGNPRPLNVNLT